jgi:hypothetical protein
LNQNVVNKEQAPQEAPIDPEMLASIDAARANPSSGIPHAEMLREFGLLDHPRTPE